MENKDDLAFNRWAETQSWVRCRICKSELLDGLELADCKICPGQLCVNCDACMECGTPLMMQRSYAKDGGL